MPRLEDFQKGIPLNDEMARLKAGVFEQPAPETPLPFRLGGDVFDDLDRPLDEAERELLARLTREPGWQILERLIERTCAKLERKAIIVSQTDPLRNAEEIAAGWAYFSMWKRVRGEMKALIEGETAKLKQGSNAGILAQ
jgi:hypothetical protein